MFVMDHTALVYRLVAEGYNQDSSAVVEALCAPTFLLNGQLISAMEFHTAIGQLHSLIPGFHITAEAWGVEEDWVAADWTIQHVRRGERWDSRTCKRSPGWTGFRLFRIAEGKIVEVWTNRMAHARLHDLGVPALLRDVP